MKKHTKTAMAMSAAVLTLVLMGTACNNNNQAVNPTPSASSTVSASPTASGNPDADATPSNSTETLTGTGQYVGLQDSHTIEITTEEGPAAFQVSPEIVEKISEWDDGTPVKFQYTSQSLEAGGEQNTIVSIDKQ